MDHRTTATTDQSALLSVKFVDDWGGLLALGVGAPHRVGMALLDWQDGFEASLTGYAGDNHDG